MITQESKQIILVIDDEPINIEFMGELLKTNYEVLFATNGQDGLDCVTAGTAPDLILLDIIMPELNGFEVCRILKESPKSKDIPVIFLTAKTQTEDIVKAFKMGAADYVTKPFNSDELMARVRTHLELKRVRESQLDLISKLQAAKDNLEKALTRVKQLSGLLPICSNCRKIRNDQGYWELVEEYIHKHSEAEFSHSICPECLERLYPEFL
jgi:PleD family two-component response regulator